MIVAAKVSGERVGINRDNGKLLSGWDHVAQSILVIFTTRLNTRLMLLDFGSDITGLIDAPGNSQTFARFYSAMVEAIVKWEPGFRVSSFAIVQATQDGAFTIQMSGIYYPRGHLGDYSVSENATMRFVMAATNSGVIFTGAPI